MPRLMPGRLLLCISLLLMALGFGVRLYGIETQILWHDEVYTRFFVSGHRAAEWKAVLFTGKILDVDEVLAFQNHDSARGVMATLRGLAHDEPQHPPLYYALLRIWIGWFGDGTATLRILSAVFSVIAIPAMYWFCQELFGLRRVSLLASAILTASPLFVRYAQEAREYSLWSMLILLSCAALLRAVRESENRSQVEGGAFKWWALFSLIAAVALYTSLSTVAVLGALVLFLLIRDKGRLSRTTRFAAVSFSFSVVLFLPWAWLIWEHFDSFQASMAWSKQIVVPRHEILTTLALSVSRPFLDFWDELNHPAAIVCVSAAIIFLAGALSYLRQSGRDARILLCLLILFPVSILIVPDLIFGGIRSVSTRYLMPVLLALIATVAFWFAGKPSLVRNMAGAALVLVGLFNCIYNTTRPSWTKGISMSMPEAARIIHQAQRPLVVGNMERHHPGNLIALCHLLRPGTKLQFLDHGVRYKVPADYDVFLFSPIPPFLEDLKNREKKNAVLLFEDLHLSLYRVEGR